MARTGTSVAVEVTPDEVWAVIAADERWPEWFPAAEACRTTSEAAGGVGSARWVPVHLFKVNERLVAWEPPHRWAFTILDANLPGIVSVVEQAILEPVGDTATRVTYTPAADTKPYRRPVVPLLRWRLNRLFRTGLAGIQAQVETLRAEAGYGGASNRVVGYHGSDGTITELPIIDQDRRAVDEFPA